MPLTDRQLNRATLARQSLLRRSDCAPVEAVARLVALQAQEPMSPYVALWNRIRSFDPATLDSAFRDRLLVKAPLMRITLHAVASADYTTLHEAMVASLRASRLNDRRFGEAGVSVKQAKDLIEPLVRFTSKVRTKEEILGFLSDELGTDAHDRLWWALRTFAPLVHAPTEAPWAFGTVPVYRAAPKRPARPSEHVATEELVLRYLAAFGPASVADISQFSLRRRSDLREAAAGLGDTVRTLDGPGGGELLDIADGEVPGEGEPAPPRLLGMWDSVLLAYADRSRVIPEDVRRLIIRTNGDVLPALLVDGYVAGVWRFRDGGIEARAFDPIRRQEWADLDAEAASLLAMIGDRLPTYGRYEHWWAKLPSGTDRLLGV